MSLSYTCPTCSSDNVQRVSLAFASGVSVGGSVTLGGARSSGGGILGGAATSTGSATLLSSSIAPPARITWLSKLSFSVIFFALGVGVAADMLNETGQGSPGEWALDAAFFVITCWIFERFLRSVRYNQRVYPGLMRNWRAEFMCLRCSRRFFPTEIITVDTHQNNTAPRVLEGESHHTPLASTVSVPTFGVLGALSDGKSKARKVIRIMLWVSLASVGCVLLLIWLGTKEDSTSPAQTSANPQRANASQQLPVTKTTASTQSDDVDKNFSECLVGKVKQGGYSYYDGGRSAERLLEQGCLDQYLDWENSCEAQGDSQDNCVVKAAALAQVTIKKFTD